MMFSAKIASVISRSDGFSLVLVHEDWIFCFGVVVIMDSLSERIRRWFFLPKATALSSRTEKR
jgi:hypothetical protein